MKNKKLFVEAISTLLYSWGGDTPPEAYWAVNELLDWLKAEHGVHFGEFVEEIDEDVVGDDGEGNPNHELMENLEAWASDDRSQPFPDELDEA